MPSDSPSGQPIGDGAGPLAKHLRLGLGFRGMDADRQAFFIGILGEGTDGFRLDCVWRVGRNTNSQMRSRRSPFEGSDLYFEIVENLRDSRHILHAEGF